MIMDVDTMNKKKTIKKVFLKVVKSKLDINTITPLFNFKDKSGVVVNPKTKVLY